MNMKLKFFLFFFYSGHSSILCGPFMCEDCNDYISLINIYIGDDKLLNALRYFLKPGIVASFLGLLA